MYIFELILKALSAKPPKEKAEELQDYEACEHIFMPVDSTGQKLSCTNCGLLVDRNDLKYKNFFMN